MGTVYKQAFSNTIYSVIGIAAGAINTLFILPRAFEESPDDLGLIRVLLAQATIFGTVFGFGLYNLIIKENTAEKTSEYKNSILGFTLLFSFLGLGLLTLIMYSIPDLIFSLINEEEAPRIVGNIGSLICLCGVIVFTQYFSSFIINQHKSPFVQFIRDPFLKISYLIISIAYLLNPFSFALFLKLFILIYIISVVLLLGYSLYLGFKIKYSTKSLNIKVLLTYSGFTILNKGAALIVTNLDLVMIGILLNLSDVGIYSIAFFMGAVILVPQKAILAPSYPLVSNFLQKNDILNLKKLYKQSSINQLLIGGVIFTLIWVNVDSLFEFMPAIFSAKWVVFYIGLSKLFILATGISGPIIIFSKYYPYNLVFNVFLILVALASNLILIPIYGIKGAAIATAVTYALYNIIKILFIRSKFKIQPFEYSTLKVLFIFLFTIFIGSYIDWNLSPILSIMFKSLILGLVMLVLMKTLKVRAEILDKIFKLFKVQ